MPLIPTPSPATITEILNFIRSPGLRYGASELLRNAPLGAGPMSTNRPGRIPLSRGASPRQNPGISGIGEGLGSTIGRLFSQGMPQQQAEDPLMSLYQSLLDQLQSPVNMPTGIDTEDLMNQVRKAIDPIYDQRSKSAQNQSARGRKEVEDMYRALSQDYERLAPQQAAQAQQAQQQVEQLYGQLRSNIQGDYSRVSKEQGDLFKQLGIEAALPDVLAEQQAPVTDALTAAAQNQAQQSQRYMDMGQADATYFREGSPIATMRGNEIRTDMLAELQDYLAQIEAERTSGIQTSYLDQLGQAQNNLLQQQQMANSEAGRRQEMLWQMLMSQIQGGKQTPLTPDTFMSQLSPDQQQSVGSAFTRLQRSPEAIYGKVEDKRNPVPGSFVETTPQWFMAQADEMLRRGEIDPTTHQALLMYLQLYYGNK